MQNKQTRVGSMKIVISYGFLTDHTEDDVATKYVMPHAAMLSYILPLL